MPNMFSNGYALLIGIGDSLYPKWSLPTTVRDIHALKSVLVDPDLCAYPDDNEHIRLLYDTTATRKGILDSLAWLKKQADADPNATVLVYYSGHGWLEKRTRRYYLIPHDVEPHDLAGSALAATDFIEALRQISTSRLLIVIDCCHAEGMATAKSESSTKPPSGFVEKAIPTDLAKTLVQGSGRAVFASSRGEQRSWLRPDNSLSIYTYHLLEALQGAGSQPDDNVVRISNLMNYLGKTVPASARQLCQAEQTPFFDTAAEDFSVAQLQGNKGLPDGGWSTIKKEADDKIRRAVTLISSGAKAEGAEAIAVGERGVAVDGNVQRSTIVTGTGNTIENFTQYIFNLPSIQPLYQNLKCFLQRYYWVLGLIIIGEILLGLFFYRFREHFLTSWWLYSVSWWACLTAMLLLAVLIWNWNCVYQKRTAIATVRAPYIQAGLSTIGWTSLMMLLIWQMLNPQQLSADKFGIAVAAFGEGSNLRNTGQTRELSRLLLDDLQRTINEKPELVSNIELQEIGIIQNAEQGAKIGKLVGAKLILWGQILEQDKGTVIHLQVLESPGFTDDSASIRVLPIDLPSLHSSVDLKDSNALTVKQVASQQNLGLASFCLGLYYYLEQHKMALAAEQFATSLDFLQNAEPSATGTNLGLIYYYLGRSYQLQGKYEESQEMLEKATQLNPADLAAILGQVYNYGAIAMEAQKRTAASKVIDLSYQHPFNDKVIYDRALAYEALEDYDSALREYRAILKCERNDFARCQSTFFIAYLSAARVLLHLDRFNEARMLYDRAEILAQGNLAKTASFTLDMGNFYEKLGDLDRAEQAYSMTIDLNPMLASPYLYRARLRDKRNDMDAAFLDYQKFTEFSNNLSYANIVFAEFLDRIGLNELAVDKYHEALRHTTYKQTYNQVLIYAHLGRILAELDHVPDAIAAFERSLELNPNGDASITLNLGQLYESTGQASKASALYESLMKKSDQLSEDELEILQSRLNVLNIK